MPILIKGSGGGQNEAPTIGVSPGGVITATVGDKSATKTYRPTTTGYSGTITTNRTVTLTTWNDWVKPTAQNKIVALVLDICTDETGITVVGRITGAAGLLNGDEYELVIRSCLVGSDYTLSSGNCTAILNDDGTLTVSDNDMVCLVAGMVVQGYVSYI